MNQQMKFEQIEKESCTSFHYDWSIQACRSEIGLHFHPELEIIYAVNGSGYRMSGDFLEPFHAGEVVFLPSDFPHCMMYDHDSCPPNGNRESIFVQFLPDILQKGMGFSEWEYSSRRLLAIQQGMKIGGRTAVRVRKLLREMRRRNAGERLLTLWQIIQTVGQSDELTPIGMNDNVCDTITLGMKRMQATLKYIMDHYHEKIRLDDIAAWVNMSPTAFCTFFRRSSGKTLTEYVNDYRIEAACTMLKNYPDRDVSEIAWQCGFTDVPYFNRYFKREKGISPSLWRKQ